MGNERWGVRGVKAGVCRPTCMETQSFRLSVSMCIGR